MAFADVRSAFGFLTCFFWLGRLQMFLSYFVHRFCIYVNTAFLLTTTGIADCDYIGTNTTRIGGVVMKKTEHCSAQPDVALARSGNLARALALLLSLSLSKRARKQQPETESSFEMGS
jgi:hypothetical protein